MVDTKPHRNPETIIEQDARRQREAEALRENLRRRKAQARARADETAPTSDIKP